MQYDQSWMGMGLIGIVEAGAISALAAFVLYLLFHRLARHGWSEARQMGWAYFVALVLTASGDMWNLFYFNYAYMQLQSLPLLQAKLAEVHDPANMGTRVLGELIGAALGVFVAWLITGGGTRRRD